MLAERHEHSGKHDGAVPGDQRAGTDFVVAVNVELALFGQQVAEEGGDALRVHLTGMIGHGGGHADRPEDTRAACGHRLPCSGWLAATAGLDRKIYQHRAGPDFLGHFCGNQHWRLATRYRGRRDDDGHGSEMIAEKLLLPSVELRQLRLGVAATAASLLGFELDELVAYALNLVLTSGRIS